MVEPPDDRDPPIIEQDYLYGLKVVDIGDIRVARGMSRRPLSSCRHVQMVYDQKERRIWCKDCETTIEAFDAFLQIIEQFDAAASRAERVRQEVAAARNHNLVRIAAKKMDKAWSRKRSVPACPHCHAGLLPDDVDRMGAVSREIELARRKREQDHG